MVKRTSPNIGFLALTVGLASLLLLGPWEGARAAGDGTIRGDGSTLVDPLMRKWIGEYRKASGVTVDYESNGSGKGISDMTDGSVDFGCSDAPMSDEEVEAAAKVHGAVVHVPLILGAVAPIYNLPDVKERLRFSGPVLARIFLGQLHRWNDTGRRALNPGVSLPDREISVVHRLERHDLRLDGISRESQPRVAVRGRARQDRALAGRSSRQRQRRRGGSREADAVEYRLRASDVRNPRVLAIWRCPKFRRGIRGAPSRRDHGRRRGAHGGAPGRPPVLTNAPGRRSFPISTVTWALTYMTPPDGKGKQVSDFLRWIIHDGQRYGEALDFAPLPQPLVDRGEAKIRGLVDH